MPFHGPVTFPIDRVQPQPLRWLWPGVIPRGKLTVLAGDPGLGKSFVTLDLAARASAGAPWPCGGPASGRSAVVMLNAEDDPADTIRPRLEGLGADLSRIVMLDSVLDGPGRYAEFDLGLHAAELREAIERTAAETGGETGDETGEHGGVGLVVIDPVSAYVGATDSYNNAQVRAMLKPLADLAAHTGVAVVLVTHLRKNGDGAAVHRAMGSLAFTAAARVVLVATKHPDDPDLRVLSCAKSNLGADRRAFVYSIEDGVDEATPDARRGPRLRWHGECTGSADELLAGAPPRPAAMHALRAALHQRLDEAGSVAIEEAEHLCAKHGVHWATARSGQGKQRLGVRSVRTERGWRWERGVDA